MWLPKALYPIRLSGRSILVLPFLFSALSILRSKSRSGRLRSMPNTILYLTRKKIRATGSYCLRMPLRHSGVSAWCSSSVGLLSFICGHMWLMQCRLRFGILQILPAKLIRWLVTGRVCSMPFRL